MFLFLFLMYTCITTVSVTMTFFPKQKQDRGGCGIFLMRDCVITGISQISFPLKPFSQIIEKHSKMSLGRPVLFEVELENFS